MGPRRLGESPSLIKKQIRRGSKDTKKVNILVLGDSIGAGVGVETNLGLGKGYAAKITGNNKDVEFINLSVSGAKTADLLKVIQNEGTEAFTKNARLVMISIGGNDINTLLDNDALTLAVDYDALMKAYLSDFETILNQIKAINEAVQIVVVGLYNPYGDNIGIDKIDLLSNMNNKTASMVNAYPNSVYIPTYDLFKYHLNAFLTIDNFHPNAAGYHAMVERIFAVLEGKF